MFLSGQDFVQSVKKIIKILKLAQWDLRIWLGN